MVRWSSGKGKCYIDGDEDDASDPQVSPCHTANKKANKTEIINKRNNSSVHTLAFCIGVINYLSKVVISDILLSATLNPS